MSPRVVKSWKDASIVAGCVSERAREEQGQMRQASEGVARQRCCPLRAEPKLDG